MLQSDGMVAAPPKLLYLLDAASALERRVLLEWVAAHAGGRPHELIDIPTSRRRRRRRRLDPRLEAALALQADFELAPLRVAWLPEERDGVRQASFYDLLTFSDPRDPRLFRQIWLRRFHPERCRVVAGASATVAQLRERWQTAAQGSGEIAGFADFVARQAHFALERAERTLRGARYKVPRFVHEEILARADFHSGVMRLAREVGRSEAATRKTAARYLREIAANHSPFVIDLLHRAIGFIYRQGYGAVHYSQGRLKAIYAEAQRHPIVFLPTHKSNLDHLLMQYLLHENNFPPNHTAGGINMNFFPAGPIFRRTGVFFIRRTFKDNPIYKLVLRQYVDYLIEKRFPLEWYMEGGRSRTGKLLPPRLGMLSYVVDAFRRGKSEDVVLVPVSIAYDQISDVGSYVAEQRGAKKEAESFGWMMRTMRGLRRRYGNIHINFGETMSLARSLGKGDPDLAVQKLAFELAVRVNRVTPITATALVALVFLGEDDRAMTLGELLAALADVGGYVHRRGLPTTDDQALDSPHALERALAAMTDTGIVVRHAEGLEPLYGIAPGQHLAAAYYRNTVVHFFVPGAIAELALLAAAEQPTEALQVFWDEAMRLRDLLKFEFFFAEKEAFRAELREELELHAQGFEQRLASGAGQAYAILRSVRPFMAHRALRPFLEAYVVVADALVQLGDQPYEEASFLAAALALGRQYALQRRLHRAESVSKTLFASAANLAKNRGLTTAAPDLAARRRAFAGELHGILRRVDAVDALQAGRRAGVL